MITVHAYAASEAGAALKEFTYELGPLGSQEVDIKVRYCGICHSDLSMLNNDWGMTQYPFVPGHEVVEEVVAAGDEEKPLRWEIWWGSAGIRLPVCTATNACRATTICVKPLKGQL